MQTKHRKITVKCVDKDIFPMNWGCESQIESGFIVRRMTVCRVRQTAAKQATAAGRVVNRFLAHGLSRRETRSLQRSRGIAISRGFPE